MMISAGGAVQPAAGPARRDQALRHLLAREANVVDLIDHLATLNPASLLAALGLTAADPHMRQEEWAGRGNRADLVLLDGGADRALLKVKVGAEEHGGQYRRYEESKRFRGLPRFVVSPQQRHDLPEGWTSVTLPHLLAGWASSADDEARVIAAAAARGLDGTLTRATGPLRHADRTSVAVAFRQIDVDVHEKGRAVGLALDDAGLQRTSRRPAVRGLLAPAPRPAERPGVAGGRPPQRGESRTHVAAAHRGRGVPPRGAAGRRG